MILITALECIESGEVDIFYAKFKNKTTDSTLFSKLKCDILVEDAEEG